MANNQVSKDKITQLKNDMKDMAFKKESLLDDEVQQLSRQLDKEIIKFYENKNNY
ncbi:hypothetical protein Halha_0776 [Halobacteroides halobius DSM 5150]|uniref:Spo0E like sporulation regulatory protein n=1 Tax=Halobacteroides halobius (strain ATCC 35273 / DSM 5150 / MD-1) TaxID=748449 RepID=L0K9G5_HALHC|nr:Spo0E family sporulation regulatory protein-aspartic acid phosphatase [Halobacteroides halobius]AGB40748.1 hypothetical protein Halha_0776 [Halobacteroides halobius DSM 5150]